MTSTTNYWDTIDRIKRAIAGADAILVGIGAGMSVAAGFPYGGERFMKYFGDFYERYGFTDMYAGGFYPYDSLEAYWGWWSRHILHNRYDVPVGKPYEEVMTLLNGKNYFVITTNVDHRMQRAGVDRKRFYYTQGDYGLFQCSVPCHRKTYDNEAQVRAMVAAQRDLRIPGDLIPYCPVCGKPMTMNLRIDDTFVQDEGWYAAQERYAAFIERYGDDRLVLLEFGIGYNTPGIIKYPFMRMTHDNPRALYVPVNIEKIPVPDEIKDQTVSMAVDIGRVLADLL